MLIAQISDTHLSLGGPADAERQASLRSCVSAINQLDPQPDMVVHTGDIVHNGTVGEYEVAAEILKPLAARLYVIPGNKDDRAGMQAAFPGACSRLPDHEFLQYVVDHAGVRSIFLDTRSEQSNKGTLCAARLAHLEAALDGSHRPALLFMHHPAFEVPSAPDPFQFEERQTAADLEQVIRSAAPLSGIFTGHIHRQFAGHWCDVPAMTKTALALDLRKGTDLGNLQTVPFFCLHEISTAGAVGTSLRPAPLQD